MTRTFLGSARSRTNVLGLLACALTASLVAALTGCAGGPRGRIADSIDRGNVDEALTRYDDLAAHDGDDLELLAQIALRLLEDAASNEVLEVRDDAVRELAAAGTPALAALERIGTADGPSSVPALVALGRRGHPAALRLLRGLADDSRPDVRAASTLALDPQDSSKLYAGTAGGVFAITLTETLQ